MTIHLLMDSTEYSGDLLRTKPRFQALKRLCKADVVKLHMPFIVRGELISHIKENFDTIVGNGKNLQSVVDALTSVNPDGRIAELAQARVAAQELKDMISAVKTQYEEQVVEEVDQWLASVNAEIYGLSPDVAERAFNWYFDGAAPFPSQHPKEHIPDALILSQLKAIEESGEDVSFVSNDTKFLTRAKPLLETATVFNSLHSFLTQPECLRELKDQFVEAHWPLFVQGLEEAKAGLQDRAFDGVLEMFGLDVLKTHKVVRTGLATALEEVNRPYDFAIAHNDAEEWGGGVIVFPITLSVNCQLSAWIDKHEFHEYSDVDAEIMDEDEYHYQLSYSETYVIEASATVTVDTSRMKLNPSREVSQDEVVQLILDAKFEIDDILLVGI